MAYQSLWLPSDSFILRNWTLLPSTPWQTWTSVSMMTHCWNQWKWEICIAMSFSAFSPSVTQWWVRRRVKVRNTRGQGRLGGWKSQDIDSNTPSVHFFILFYPSNQESWFIRPSLQMRALLSQLLGTLALCFAPEHLGRSPPQRWDDLSPTLYSPFWTSTTYARGCLL